MEKPILFSTKIVQAILEGRKTQTRRVVKPQRDFHGTVVGSLGYSESELYAWAAFGNKEDPCFVKSPYGKKGDLLWVRETFAPVNLAPTTPYCIYKADYGEEHTKERLDIKKWKPSIFMPKKYCRLWLEVVDVRVERLQEINNRDIEQEGACDYGCTTHRLNFQDLWDSINEKRGYGWSTNPWVWVVKFKKINYEGEK